MSEERPQRPPPRGEKERVRERSERATTAAERLALIYGTEQDRVNCPFYFKVGACLYGDKCSRQHNRPISSQTLLFKHLYLNPLGFEAGLKMTPEQLQKQFDDFFEDVFAELAKHGEIEELHVCDNLCEHMFGNVYVMYSDEESAAKCMQAVNGRFYGGRVIQAELSPVTAFKDARCRQFEQDVCARAGLCNFIHERQIGHELRAKLMKAHKAFRIRGVHDEDDEGARRGGRYREDWDDDPPHGGPWRGGRGRGGWRGGRGRGYGGWRDDRGGEWRGPPPRDRDGRGSPPPRGGDYPEGDGYREGERRDERRPGPRDDYREAHWHDWHGDYRGEYYPPPPPPPPPPHHYRRYERDYAGPDGGYSGEPWGRDYGQDPADHRHPHRHAHRSSRRRHRSPSVSSRSGSRAVESWKRARPDEQ